MSEVEELVLRELAKQNELVSFERGFRWRRGEDETRLWFQPTTAVASDFGLCATALIETVFGEQWPALDDVALARVNRRAAFGSFFVEKGRLGIRASYCIYEKEPASRWVAIFLLRAMGEQLALGCGIVQSEFVEGALAGNRANLQYPRQWMEAPNPAKLEESAKQFTERGLIATHGPHGLVLEVPLKDGPPSRLISPTAETALLHVSMDTPHPVGGVGYLATIALPYTPPRETIPDWCRFLNEEEHKMQDFVPRVGAWGVRGLKNEVVYSMFLPTDRAANLLDRTIMNWMVQRTFWLKNRYWLAGIGLTRGQVNG
jgi:hypothetical protein